MKEDMSRKMTDQCRTCYRIIGKGSGYSDYESQKEADTWFEGTKERREHETKNSQTE